MKSLPGQLRRRRHAAFPHLYPCPDVEILPRSIADMEKLFPWTMFVTQDHDVCFIVFAEVPFGARLRSSAVNRAGNCPPEDLEDLHEPTFRPHVSEGGKRMKNKDLGEMVGRHQHEYE